VNPPDQAPAGAPFPPDVPAVPPVLSDPPAPSVPAPVPPAGGSARTALFLLALYVAIPAVLGFLRSPGDGAALPDTVRRLLTASGLELVLFGVVFAAAAWLGRLRRADLWVSWRGVWVLPRAAAWSVALRIGVGLALGGSLAVWHLITRTPLENLDGIRPKVEAMVDVAALRDPVYLGLMLTWVSFVLAGLREELWRAGMIVLLGRVAPRVFGGRAGPWLSLAPIALLFGMAHAQQGWFGVAATGLLGFGLGAVMLLHRSLWDAVLAHGFFNAATFALLPWLAHRFPELTR